MFTISGSEIEVTRGDTGILNIKSSNYTFVEGDTVELSVKKNKKDNNCVIKKVVSSFVDNSAKIFFTTLDTSIEPGKYWYDIQFNLIDGRVETVIEPSRFKIKEDITT